MKEEGGGKGREWKGRRVREREVKEESGKGRLG